MNKKSLANQCPLCLRTNDCRANDGCWCMQAKVPEELIALAKKSGKSTQCICQRCIEKFKESGQLPSSAGNRQASQ